MKPTGSVTDTNGAEIEALAATVLHDVLEDNITDVATVSANGTYVYVSPAATLIFGWEPAEMIGRAPNDFIHPADLPAVMQARRSASGLDGPHTYVATYRFRCKAGFVWTESASKRVNDPRHVGESLVVSSVREIADRRLTEVQPQRMAITDPLTGISNRAVFMDRLSQSLRRLGRCPSTLAVIYLGLDHFRVFNASFGRQSGDHLLTCVAERASAILRPGDTIARLGADEFVILAEAVTDIGQATQMAVRVCANIREPIDINGESARCTVSAGVSVTSDAACTPSRLLQEADLALYRAKQWGRDRTEVFHEGLRTTAVGRMGIEQMVRQAVQDDRLVVHYQPIIDLLTGHVVSVEALVRIQGPDGLIFPDVFVDVADDAGLLDTIDDWVLDVAVKQAKCWAVELADTDFRGIAINVTARHMSNSYFAESIAALVTDHALPRGALSIEVTERVLMQASNSSRETLRAIRRLGVDVGLDDFGTGYSALAYLRDFPLDFIKIDQSFIRKISEPVEGAIVTAIIELAHALDLRVIAEGVETDKQAGVLVELGCDRAQGFLFSHAEEPAKIADLIRARVNLTPESRQRSEA